MAEININLRSEIHAEIAEGNFTMFSRSSTTIDPITKSYSESGKLVYYKLSVKYSEGVSNIIVLENGKNSRVSAEGKGYFQLELLVRDENNLTATHLITVKVV